MPDKTTLPIVKEEIQSSFVKGIVGRNLFPYVVSTLLPSIAEYNPLVEKIMLTFAEEARGRAIENIPVSNPPIDPKTLDSLAETVRRESLIAAAFVYMLLEEQGKADRAKKV